MIENIDYLFFFPFFHVGGAERVHISILEVFKDSNCLCIITERSSNENFRSEFEKYSTMLVLEDFNLNHRYKRKFGKKISKSVDRSGIKVVFGSNNMVFYDTIKFLKKVPKKIDLYHAFTYENLHALEKTTLEFVPKITTRIVLGQHTKSDFKILYQKNGIDAAYLDRIKIIQNCVDIPNEISKNYIAEKLKVLYVGRNSEEKRAHLFIEIAHQSYDKNLGIGFTMVGDFEDSKDECRSENLHFVGEIVEKSQLYNLYDQHHIIIITSSREGLPMVLLEGMAHGLISIATDVGEISELVNSDNGFLIPNHEDEKLIVKNVLDILISLDKDKALLKGLSEQAKKSVRDRYTFLKFSQSYTNLFNS